MTGTAMAAMGAFLTLFYPPRLPQFTKEGAPILSLLANPTKEGKKKGEQQWWLSALGQCLLAVGLLLQFIASWLS